MHSYRRMTSWAFRVAALAACAAIPVFAGNTASTGESVAVLHPEMVLRVYEKPHPGTGLARALSFDFLVGGECFFPCQLDVPGTEDYLYDITPSSAVNTKALTAYVAWSRQNPSRGDYDVAIAAFASTAWVASQVVVNAPGDDIHPQIAVGPNGNVHLVYEAGGEIEYREFSAGLSLIWAQSISKDLGTTASHDARLTVDSKGYAWIAYLGNSGGGEQVVLAGQHLGDQGGGVNTAISPLRVSEVTRIVPPVPRGGVISLAPPTVEMVGSVPLAYWIAADSVSGVSIFQFVHPNTDGTISEVGRLPLSDAVSADRAASLAREFVRAVYDSAALPTGPGGTIGIVIDPQSIQGGSSDPRGDR